MEKNAALYDVTQNLASAIFRGAFARFQQKPQEEQASLPQVSPLLTIRGGYAESPAWMMVQVQEFHPEPLTVEKFRVRAVYAAPGLSYAMLELLASEKWLDRRGENYHLTDAGQATLDLLAERRTRILGDYLPLEEDRVTRLESLLRRVIDASLHADDPPGTWCIDHSRNRADDSASNVQKIIQYVSDFNSFRDDAHMAAYGGHGVAGHIWEAFTYVAGGKAADVEALFDAIAYRGFSREDWHAAYADLVARGWLTADGEMHTVTEAGQAVFDEVEAQTDAYFFAPWSVLSNDEYAEVVDLMQAVIKG